MNFKKLVLFSLSFATALLSACGSNETNENNNNNNENNNNDTTNTSALVVYFSATGNTERVAELIANRLDSKIYELELVDPYTDADLAYSNSDGRVSQERNNPNHLTELVNTDFDGFEEAKYIFLGAPIWWGQLSWVINDFILSNDFTDKTIIPFATSSSSTFDVESLKYLSDEATWLEGMRFRHSEITEERINSWIDSLGIDF